MVNQLQCMSTATTLPFFRLTLVWISGIILAICHPIDLSITLMFLLALTLLYLSVFTKCRLRQAAFPWPNLIGLLLMLLISYSHVLLQMAQKQQEGLSEGLSENQPLEGYQVCIKKVYTSFNHSLTCTASVIHIRNHSGWHNSTGSIQLYFSKKCDYKPEKGDILLIRGRPACILLSEQTKQASRFSSLPNQPIYRHFLKKRDFSFLMSEKSSQSRKWSVRIEQWCSNLLDKQLKDEQAIALVETLLLGAKDRLKPDLRKAYAYTGTIHVLAISGLHVGMLYWLIGSVFRFVFTKIGFCILSELFTLLGLWLYGWLCHFAPPILRATMMITMARLEFLIRRASNSYNGLFASAFALLLWDPFLLLNWGFQLSYMATLGILYLQPYLNSVLTVKNNWLQKIWKATTLSIAAQVSTLPLILYYFKQFPFYFIIANWVVVPAIFAILVLSLALIVVSGLPVVNTLLGFTLNKLILATNAFVYWVAQWPMSTLDDCAINGDSVCLLYIIFLAFCRFCQYKNLIYPIVISLCTALYAAKEIQTVIAAQNRCQVICTNNHHLSFTLKDGIETLRCDDLPSRILQPYAGGIMAAWYGKAMVTINAIPSDWYGWRSAKLDADYLFIEEKLLNDIAILTKVFNFKTLVIYRNKAYPLRYYPTMQPLGIELIWLQPGGQKVLTWSKNP